MISSASPRKGWSPWASIGPALLALLAALAMGALSGCAQGTGSGPVAVTGWKFAVVADTGGLGDTTHGEADGVRVSVLGPMAAAMAADGVELVLVPGDLVMGSPDGGDLAVQLTRWRATMAPLYGAGVPVYAIRGNHDLAWNAPNGTGETPLAQWRRVMADLPQNGPAGEAGLTYRVQHKEATFIGFDQYIGRNPGFRDDLWDSTINTGMINPWVFDQIRAAPGPWVFVFGHEPAFIANAQGCLANVPAERDALWDALGARQGMYLCGHDHLYRRARVPDINRNLVTELIVGTGGTGFHSRGSQSVNATIGRGATPRVQYANDARSARPYFGYLLMTVGGDRVQGEWKAFTNYRYATWTAPPAPLFEARDTFTITLR